MIGAGILLAFNPLLFVKVFRKLAIGDYYIRSQEFEKSVVTPEGRIAGFFFFCVGLLFLYAWLRAAHVMN